MLLGQAATTGYGESGKYALFGFPLDRLTKKKKKSEEEERRDTRPRKSRIASAKCQKGDALVMKTAKSEYSKVLKTMRKNTKLMGLQNNVRRIRLTHTGEMILKLRLK